MQSEDEAGGHSLPREKDVVLVVDDDPLQAGQIASFLQKHGIPVVVETNGFVAVQAMRRLRPVTSSRYAATSMSPRITGPVLSR